LVVDGLDDLYGIMKRGEYTKMRGWVAEHKHQDVSKIMKAFLIYCDEALIPESYHDAMCLYNEHDYKNAFVVDKEINLATFFGKILVECEFK